LQGLRVVSKLRVADNQVWYDPGMKEIAVYALGWGIATTLVWGVVAPAFLWANTPRPELTVLETVCWTCTTIGAAMGAWLGWRRSGLSRQLRSDQKREME
jgi:hypothetical protein